MGTGCTFSSLREAAKILYLKTVINLYIWSQNTLYKELVLQLFSTHDIDKFSKLEKKAMVKYIFIQKKKKSQNHQNQWETKQDIILPVSAKLCANSSHF